MIVKKCNRSCLDTCKLGKTMTNRKTLTLLVQREQETYITRSLFFPPKSTAALYLFLLLVKPLFSDQNLHSK